MARDPMIAIKSAITQFDNAAQEYAFRGAYHPDDRPAIEERYLRARQRLEQRIAAAVTAAKG